MQLIAFDLVRSFGIPHATHISPEYASKFLNELLGADWLLFPEYWQVNALYYGLRKPVFPSISTYHIGHDKIQMTRAVQLLWPRSMPETFILKNTPSAQAWVPEHFSFPFVAKSARESQGRGVWLIQSPHEWSEYSDRHPTLYVQEHLPIDRDMRLVVIGRKVVAAYWRHRPPDGFHTNVAKGGCIVTTAIPQQAIELVEKIAQCLDIDHAGFDIAQVDDRFYFLEFNRLFGTAGILQLGISLGPLIYQYLEEKSKTPLAPITTSLPAPFRRAS